MTYAGTKVYYTGDLITNDEPCKYPDFTECQCSDLCGDGTEHGYGQTLHQGWVDPDWSLWQVEYNHDNVRPDLPFGTVFEPDAYAIAEAIVGDVLYDAHLSWSTTEYYRTYEDTLLDTICDRLGAIDSWDGETAYAADEIQDYRTGESVRLAAHVHREA